MKIGLFYGSSTCYTEMAAEKIRDILGDDLVELHDVKETDLQLTESYPVLILGIPTWDFGEIQEDWLAVWDQLPQLDLSGKIVAMYGMGDQVDYSDWFLDALGYLHQQLQSSGVKFAGYWPVDGYTFTSPKALTPDGKHFVGLALDDVNQYDESEERIATWCMQILEEVQELL